jgi:uncharacterized protein YbcI
MDAAAPQAEVLSSAISREMVRLYKNQFGRGPTKAHTLIARDVIVCTLEQSLTPAERRMVELGELHKLRDVRLFFQHATEKEFKDIIEGLTGRKVRAFISGMDVERDVASEVFYLEPRVLAVSDDPAAQDGASNSDGASRG